MMLKIGDKIYCKKVIGKGLTLDKCYEVTHTRPKDRWNGNDICIKDDSGQKWWFGQIGETECWTNWFVSEKKWIRENKLNILNRLFIKNKVKSSIVLIGLGTINLLHAGMHLIQFLQSLLLVRNSIEEHHHNNGIIDTMLHSPYFAVLWGIVGLFTLWIGIKDFIHHKKCNH